MRSLLITGGAGFIGANFVHYWASRHPQDRLVVLDALTYAGNRANLAGLPPKVDFRFVHGDICDQPLVERLLDEKKIDTIVHFAAESHVDRSISGPDAFIQTNIIGTYTLLKAAKKAWLDQPAASDGRITEPADGFLFHQVSTDEVYGTLGPDDPPFRETTPFAPNSPYAASKAAGDHLVRSYHHTYGLPVTTSNCSNNYGPYQFPEKLIPLVLLNALAGKPLPIYGDGANIRDWLQVDDHCLGIELVMTKGRRGETYNLGGCNELSNLEIVSLICRAIDQRFATDAALNGRFPHCPAAKGENCADLITFVKDRPGHDRRYAIDPGKAQQELGYAPACTLAEGIKDTIDWYLANETWWRAVLNGSYADWLTSNYANRG